MDDSTDLAADNGTLTLEDESWREARRRAEVIGPIANSATVTQEAAEVAARKLGVTGRTVYALVRAWRRSGGRIPILVPATPTGGRGKPRIDIELESIIADAVDRFYLQPQKPCIAAVAKEVRRRCRLRGVHPPALNTVKNRIDKVRPDKVLAKREGSDAARRLKPAPGSTPQARAPLDVIQIDHTKIDLIVVDGPTRLPIGRPYLTVAIDEFSRCIVGICVTLEAPSATSVGLCITHIAANKGPWLERMRAALTRLREQGREQIDEASIFKAVEQMRTIVDTAKKETRAARRQISRRAHLPPAPEKTQVRPPADTSSAEDESVVRAFDEIEEW